MIAFVIYKSGIDEALVRLKDDTPEWCFMWEFHSSFIDDGYIPLKRSKGFYISEL